MQTLATLTRHGVTYLVGILTAWLTLHLTAPEEIRAATDAAAALVEPLVVLAGFTAVIVARLAMPMLNKIFRRSAGEESGGTSGGTSLLVMVVSMSMAVAAGTLLPSCATAPLTGSVSYTDPATGAEVRVIYQPNATK